MNLIYFFMIVYCSVDKCLDSMESRKTLLKMSYPMFRHVFHRGVSLVGEAELCIINRGVIIHINFHGGIST